ncbi:MAG TPA: NADH-quinone oxidoreductase subunit H, partial [Candidatus Dormibacteraeota bacterium]|nr:NADH-quinone oxidoreductase subunit H [Candidatus Dormibacteraeota bacterium]
MTLPAWDDLAQIAGAIRGGLSAMGLRGLVLDGVMALIGVFVLANFALANGGLMSYVWRKEMAYIQDRHGPNRVGPGGLL